MDQDSQRQSHNGSRTSNLGNDSKDRGMDTGLESTIQQIKHLELIFFFHFLAIFLEKFSLWQSNPDTLLTGRYGLMMIAKFVRWLHSHHAWYSSWWTKVQPSVDHPILKKEYSQCLMIDTFMPSLISVIFTLVQQSYGKNLKYCINTMMNAITPSLRGTCR